MSEDDSLTRERILEILKAAQDKLGYPEVYHKTNDENPRFILFHAPFSTCSEKVRSVLMATKAPWTSYALNMQNSYATNYSPEYVTLRKVAWEQLEPNKPPLLGEEGTSGWNGNNSVTQHGLDLTAVPTLVDLYPNDGKREEDAIPKVIVDSEFICHYLAEHATAAVDDAAPLIPADTNIQALIEKHMKLVDDLPQAALILGGNPADDQRPSYVQLATEKGLLLAGRTTAIEKALADKGTKWTDPILERAYQAKLEKNQQDVSNQEKLKQDQTELDALIDKVYEVLSELEEDLTKSKTGWVCGAEHPTMIDYVYGASMYRLVWLGMGDFLFGRYPKVKEFVDKAFALEALQEGVLFFPGSPPSHATNYLHERYQGGVAAFFHATKTNIFTGLATLKISLS